MRPVKKGDRIGEIVQELVLRAREHVSISTVYADSEFCSVKTIWALQDAGVKYIIPSPKNQRVKREISRMQQEVKAKSEYAIYNSARDRAETTLVLVPSSADESKTVAFITNKAVKDEISLD